MTVCRRRAVTFFVFLGGPCMKKIIELKNITKAFDGEPVLQNVNLDI